MNAVVNDLWQSQLGAIPAEEGVQFSVWAPRAKTVDVVFEGAAPGTLPLTASPDGIFRLHARDAKAGNLYKFRLDGDKLYPDPASRFQPLGVHGPSQVVDLRGYSWETAQWPGIELKNAIIYEAHVGTATPDGTFAGMLKRLPYLADLGVTALELMPVADFDGQRNWGYDGVSLFAPSRNYGTPHDLQQLIDGAHRLRLAVILDVVYNHLGPSGNYLGAFSPYYFASRHQTPWGAAVNLDGEHADKVREYLIENALHWVHDYRVDGLRFDATHALVDDSDRHFLAELTGRIKNSAPERNILCIAEDARNAAQIIKPESADGMGMDGVWADDFHHQVRRSLAGDSEGYYQDFTGSVKDLCVTIQRGWFYTGQNSKHWNGPRGTDPTGIDLERFIVCIQNHDQIGNRAMGERLSEQIDAASFRTASALLLSVPETPLLYMGQEWAASSPLLFFTDYAGDLGQKVTEGRRAEFKAFSTFADAASRARIPDPQDVATFERSRLNGDERMTPKHAAVYQLYRALLHWRRHQLSAMDLHRGEFTATPVSDDAFWLEYWSESEARMLILFQWKGKGRHQLPANETDYWRPVLSTEDPAFCLDPDPIRLDNDGYVHFGRPGALILGPRGS